MLFVGIAFFPCVFLLRELAAFFSFSTLLHFRWDLFALSIFFLSPFGPPFPSLAFP